MPLVPSPEFEWTPMRSGAAAPAGFGCGRIHCGTGLAISKIEIHYPRPIRIDADLLLIVVRIHAGEPLILVRKLSPRYLTPFRPGVSAASRSQHLIIGGVSFAPSRDW